MVIKPSIVRIFSFFHLFMLVGLLKDEELEIGLVSPGFAGIIVEFNLYMT